MEYKIKKINVEAESVDSAVFPNIKDRIIEKRGSVQEFTFNDIELNMKNLVNTKKEVESKLTYEKAKAENIEHFHNFVKDMTEEDLHTCYMYYEASSFVKLAEKKLNEINTQIERDEEEIDEIKFQIPELVVAPIVEEAIKIINE